MRAAISVMVLSSDRILADALSLVLAGEANLRIIAPEARGAEVDVILIDAAVDRAAALTATALMREICEDAGLLVLGLSREDEGVLDFIQAGATGYILQDTHLTALIAAIHALSADETLCSPRMASAALARLAALSREATPAAEPGGTALTGREREILLLIDQGLGNKEIARTLAITVPTVKNHVHHILEKLNVNGRREAVRLAYEIGLLRESFDS